MCHRQLQVLILTALTVGFVFASAVFSAETWHLKDSQAWEKIEDSPQGKQMLEIANIKQLVAGGKPEEARAAITKLQQSDPTLTTEGIDTYIEAEMFYADGKWLKANRKYNDFLDSSTHPDLRKAALERQFSIAVAFLNGEKKRVLKVLKLKAYEEADTILHKIAERVGDDTPFALRALVTLAEGYQKQAQYLDSYHVWLEIVDISPTGDAGRNAFLQMAQTLHSAYNGPKYDSASLDSARSYYEEYKTKYPHFTAEKKIDAKVALVDQQIAYKQYTIGKHYESAENIAAANIYYRYVVKDWPSSRAAELSKSRLLALESGKTVAADKNLLRKAFDKSSWFFDNWFGLSKLKRQSQ